MDEVGVTVNSGNPDRTRSGMEWSGGGKGAEEAYQREVTNDGLRGIPLCTLLFNVRFNALTHCDRG